MGICGAKGSSSVSRYSTGGSQQGTNVPQPAWELGHLGLPAWDVCVSPAGDRHGQEAAPAGANGKGLKVKPT